MNRTIDRSKDSTPPDVKLTPTYKSGRLGKDKLNKIYG